MDQVFALCASVIPKPILHLTLLELSKASNMSWNRYVCDILAQRGIFAHDFGFEEAFHFRHQKACLKLMKSSSRLESDLDFRKEVRKKFDEWGWTGAHKQLVKITNNE